MNHVILQQKPGSFLFDILLNGRSQGKCDLITAEEVANTYLEAGVSVEWVYPEDFSLRRDSVRIMSEVNKGHGQVL